MWRTSFFWMLSFLAILSWASWYIVLHNVSPVQSAGFAFPLFYGTFFFSITFTIALVMALVWKAFIPTKSSYYCLRNGVREGFLLGVISSIALFFQQYNHLSWQEITIFCLLFLLIEGFFMIQSE